MTPELLKSEADNCDAQSGLSPAPLLGVRERNREELNLVKSEIREVKKRLHKLAVKANTLRDRVRIADQRANGERNDDERMMLLNEESKKTASLHWSRWDDVDESFVIENKDKMTQMDIAKHLGRTHKSVKDKIYRINKTVALTPNAALCDPAHGDAGKPETL